MTATATPKRKAKVLRPSRVAILIHYDPWDPASAAEAKATRDYVRRAGHRRFYLLCHTVISRPALGTYYRYAEFATA